MRISKMIQLFFILLPRTAGHYHGMRAAKFIYAGDGAGLLRNFYHTVKTGIAANGNIVYTNGSQQELRVFVLNKKMRNAAQHLALNAAVPPEKSLLVPEHAA